LSFHRVAKGAVLNFRLVAGEAPQKVRAPIKIAVTLQRAVIALTFVQAIVYVDL
jgi:hypothetical protein